MKSRQLLGDIVGIMLAVFVLLALTPTMGLAITDEIVFTLGGQTLLYKQGSGVKVVTGSIPTSMAVGNFDMDVEDELLMNYPFSTGAHIYDGGTGNMTRIDANPFNNPVVGDFNGDGIDEVAFNLGGSLYISGVGLIDGTYPTEIVAGDFNGDKVDELVFSYSFAGTYRYNNGVKSQIDGSPYSKMIVGNFVKSASDKGDEIVFALGGGLYLYDLETSSRLIQGSVPSGGVASGDFDGDGQDEVLLNYPFSTGAHIYDDNAGPGTATTTQIDGSQYGNPVIGNFVKSASDKGDEIVFALGGGLYLYDLETSSRLIQGSVPSGGVAAGDFDGDGQDEVLLNYPFSTGAHIYDDNAGPGTTTTTRIDANPFNSPIIGDFIEDEPPTVVGCALIQVDGPGRSTGSMPAASANFRSVEVGDVSDDSGVASVDVSIDGILVSDGEIVKISIDPTQPTGKIAGGPKGYIHIIGPTGVLTVIAIDVNGNIGTCEASP